MSIKGMGKVHGCLREKSFQSCQTLCDPIDCSPPGSSVHGILPARILEWVAMPFSRGFSQPGIEPTSLMSPALAGGFFTTSATWEALMATQLYGVFCVSGTFATHSPSWRTTVLWTKKRIQWPVRASGHMISCPCLLSPWSEGQLMVDSEHYQYCNGSVHLCLWNNHTDTTYVINRFVNFSFFVTVVKYT